MTAVFRWLGTQTLPAGSGELPPFLGGYWKYDPSLPVSYPTPPAQHPYKFHISESGFYVATLNLGMLPGADAEGNIILDLFSGAPPQNSWANKNHILLRWKAGSGYTQQGNAVVFYADAGDIFYLRYDASAQASINHEPYASRLTIHKV